MPCSSETARWGTRIAPFFSSTAARTRAYWPGRTIAAGVREGGLHQDRARSAASTLRSTKTSVALLGMDGAVGEDQLELERPALPARAPLLRLRRA